MNMRSPEFLPEALIRLLFETQIWYWAGGVGIGIILLMAGRNRASKPLLKSSLAVMAAMLVWMLLAWIIVTPAERLYAVHSDLAATVKEGDNMDRLFSHMTDDFECPQLGERSLAEAKAIIGAALDRLHIKNNHVRAYKSKISGKTALTQVTFMTESETGWTKTTWELHWLDMPGGDWKIRVADFQTLNDSPAPDLSFGDMIMFKPR